MTPKITKEEYLESVGEGKESVISINSQQKNKSLLKSANNEGSNYLPLCIKNYKTQTGFSNYIHTHLDDEYLISGNYVMIIIKKIFNYF